MELLNERNQIKSVARRWRESRRNIISTAKKDAETARALESLPTDTATAEQVAAIIGNASWCAPQQCNECKEYSWDVVQLGEEPDYESATANVCGKCLCAAVQMIERASRDKTEKAT